MLSSFVLGALFGTLLVIPDVSSFTKYGRTCKDIGCMRDEVCVILEDPCSIYQRDNCGRYPTCQKTHPGGASCASTVCGENEYCRTENGVPKCVKKSGDAVPPARRPGRPSVAPTPPPRSSSYGDRRTGSSGSRNTIGSGSIFDRLFGGDRNRGTGGQITPRPTSRPGGNGYYNSHTSVDATGNRIWTFSG